MGYFVKEKKYDGQYDEMWVSYKRLCYEVDHAYKMKVLTGEGFKFILLCFFFFVYVLISSDVQSRYLGNMATRNMILKTPFDCLKNESSLSDAYYASSSPTAGAGARPSAKASAKDKHLYFDDIRDQVDMWCFLDAVVFDVIMASGNVPVPSMSTEDSAEEVTAVSDEKRMSPWEFIRYNQLVWGVRFRQARVKSMELEKGEGGGVVWPKQCPKDDFVVDYGCGVEVTPRDASDNNPCEGLMAKMCVPAFSSKTEDTEGNASSYFGSFNASGAYVNRYRYLPAKAKEKGGETTGASAFGKYPGGGWVYDLNATGGTPTVQYNATQMKEWQDNLKGYRKAAGWGPFVDDHTAALFVEFTSYGVNSGLFTHTQLRFEFNADGAVKPSLWNRVQPLMLKTELGIDDIINLVFSVLLVWYVFNFLWMITKGVRFLQKWHVFEAITYALLSCHLYYMFFRYVADWQSNLWSKLNLYDTFYESDEQYGWRDQLQIIYGLSALTLAIRLFKYMKQISGPNVMYATLERSSGDLAVVFVMMVVVIFFIASSLQTAFGPYSSEYADLLDALTAELIMVMGEISLDGLRAANDSWSFTYYLVLASIFKVVLGNLFLGIVLYAWQREKQLHDIKKGKTDKVSVQALMKHLETEASLATKASTWRNIGHMCASPRQACAHICQEYIKNRRAMKLNEVLTRLNDWHLKKSNRNKTHMCFDDVKKALEGTARDFRYIGFEYTAKIFGLCDHQHRETGRKYMLTEFEKQQEEEALEQQRKKHAIATQATLSHTTKNLEQRHLAEMKRLVHTFKIMHQDKMARIRDLTEKLDGLKKMQTSTYRSMEMLSRRVKEFAPARGKY